MIPWRNRSRETEPKKTVTAESATPDATLVRAAQRGNKQAFVKIVARHQAMVCGVAFSILGDFTASQDAGQETFLMAWRKIHDLREPEKLRAWLAQIVRNAALGHLRGKRGHDALDDALPDQVPGPDETAATAEEAAIVRDSLSKLPETYRVPLVLFYCDGQSVRAVAETLEISEDAVKQRLARGREMLREQMSGLVESVLTRARPTGIFTMTIAVAIGALATPAAIAGTVFTVSSAAASTTSSSALSSQVLIAMSTTKTCLIVATLVAAVCLPIGYRVATNLRTDVTSHDDGAASGGETVVVEQKASSDLENSLIFAQWRKLHENHGTNAEAMPAIYDAIAALTDPSHRRAFRSALIAEWVQLDAPGGFEFFLGQRDATQRGQFFQEWLALDANGAVNALLGRRSGWVLIARDSLSEIARKVPSRVLEILEHLPKPTGYWDTRVRDAYVIVAEADLKSARTAAEALARSNPHREQILAGVAQTWGKTDLKAAIEWASTLPEAIRDEGGQHEEIIRAALLGKASVDPVGALDQIGIVPPGGKEIHSASTTGARVLKEAAKADYDATVAWIAAHPGRLGSEDLSGMAGVVTDRLNADPTGFLARHAADNTLAAIMPALGSALLNEGGGQRAIVWEWLKTQPETEATKELQKRVLRTAGWQDSMQALRLAAELPQTAEGDARVRELASTIFNGGQAMHRLDKLLEHAPEQMRQPLIENAFTYLREDTLTDPQVWIARLAFLPESSRRRAAGQIAGAWAAQAPDEAVAWLNTMPAGATRDMAMHYIITSWAAKDMRGAADWTATLPAGAERDRGAGTLVLALAERNPTEALEWMMAIGDSTQRERIAAQAAQTMAARNPAAARQWIETAPFTPEMKAQLRERIPAKASH
jgi:RNA polymerase sigma factor (sigma-70 family)